MKEGTASFLFPFKITWIKTEYPIPYPAQIAIAVPKRRYKRANKRNLIRRRIREAYRAQKDQLYNFLEERHVRIQLLVVYIAPEIMDYHELEPKLSSVLKQIMAGIKKSA